MRKTLAVRNLIASLFVTGIVLYLMAKTTSPKIIFVPFLICGLSLAGKSFGQFMGREKWVTVFHKLFILGFLLFWFGFLAVAVFLSIRDKSYGMLLFTLPFWVVGFFITKNKLLGIKGKQGKKDTVSPFRFAFVVSTILVSIAILAGIFLFILGIQRKETGLLFAGGFFTLGALTFVLGWLTINGRFQTCKVDVLGLYMGFLLSGIGMGILVWKFADLRFWILIPVLMVIAGVVQIIKSLKKRK